ncbi:hypothetical protein CONLIGDRAFT_212531 [Coniochaeta ligniaria NRRL 30616]|uniref:Uncharacterized protein n=1 Tax=Coniochaeta ligniaria NRRL 30616 TaxID=1408157 RepID=A0A1J7J456_9PEZI|nr:hypothetical protein CONLIGDRAFT_212531 [Coniochaeta ligniaria NRRL 30616]
MMHRHCCSPFPYRPPSSFSSPFLLLVLLLILLRTRPPLDTTSRRLTKMEDQRQLGRSPGHLNSGRIELPPPRPTRSNPFWLPIYHSPIKENLQKLFIARTMLIATGWYASAEQRHKAGGFVSAMYIQPDNIAQQSERAISLAYIHDVFLRELRRQFGDHECMLDTLCRHLLTQISCTAKATSILYAVHPWSVACAVQY